MVDQGSLQGSLSRWKPIQALPFLLPHRCLRPPYRLRGYLSETVNPPSPPAFSLLLANFAASTPRPLCNQLQSEPFSAILQLDVIRAFLGCFVIDVAIILFNRRGLVTFLGETFFCLVKSNIYIFYFISCIFFVYLFSLCIYFLLCLCLFQNNRAYGDVLHIANRATIQEVLVLK